MIKDYDLIYSIEYQLHLFAVLSKLEWTLEDEEYKLFTNPLLRL